MTSTPNHQRLTSRPLSLLFVIGCLIMLGCTHQTTAPATTASGPQQSSKPIPESWDIKAKLGIRNTLKNGNSGSVFLDWQQRGDEYRIRVSGPLGQGGANITGNHHQITIKPAGKAPLTSNKPEQLIRDTFGWDFPLRDLSYWIRGLASPYRSNTQLAYAKDDTLSSLKQSVWSMTYERYQPAQEWLMPAVLRTEKDGLSLKLVIRQWQLNPSS